MARILIVGGGCRGRSLAKALADEGHALLITSREGSARAEIEAAGAICWPGDPDRLATLRGALDGVTILIWLLGGANGTPASLLELHTSRLEFFISQAIDTTVRGFVFEARGGSTPAEALIAGGEVVRSMTERNAIPVAYLREDPGEPEKWLAAARTAVQDLLGS